MKRQGIEETVEWEKSLKLAHECICTKDQIAALEGECLKELKGRRLNVGSLTPSLDAQEGFFPVGVEGKSALELFLVKLEVLEVLRRENVA